MQTPVQITRLKKSEFHAFIRRLDTQKRVTILEPQLPLELLSLKNTAGRPAPECTECGACCKFALIVPVTHADCDALTEYVSITADDWDAEIEIDRALSRNSETGHCVHLAAGSRSVGCTIYDDRPATCRDFEAGSDRCLEYRRMYGIDRQLTAAEAAFEIAGLRPRIENETIEDVAIVPAAKISKASYGPDGVEYSESTQLKLFAFLSDETPHELHTFDSAKENWLENDLIGRTLAEAEEMIAARQIW